MSGSWRPLRIVYREQLILLAAVGVEVVTPAVLRPTCRWSQARGPRAAEIRTVRRALYPDRDTALAYLTLFAMRIGIVPDGIDALTLADITHTSADAIVLSYNQGPPGTEALTCPTTLRGRGPAASRGGGEGETRPESAVDGEAQVELR